MTPGGLGIAVVTLTDIKDLTAVVVGIVTIGCTLAVTIRNLSKR